MAKKKSMVYPVVFMLVLAGVLTAILAFINEQTLPTIQFNEEIELKEKILNVFDILPENATPEIIDTNFNESITTEDYEGNPLYIYKQNGETVAYAVPFDGPGLWGSINGYLGITADKNTITGIEFIKQEETPGLGGRIAEDEYKNQYRDLDISNIVNNEIIINRPAPGGNVDAIAGATQTSTFVTNMLNEDVIAFIETWKGE
ncbi:MAG: FMN-binding protein [Tissierellia bacterium]|nr:FMN-binding protein [Tissierellia bacterium]